MTLLTPEPGAVEIVNALRREFGHNLAGYLHGKSVMRDFLVQRYALSELEAEETLDRLEERSWVRFDGDPTKASHQGSIWKFNEFQG